MSGSVPTDPLTSVAVTTLIVLALLGLHLEVVAGVAAWLSAWWLLRASAD